MRARRDLGAAVVDVAAVAMVVGAVVVPAPPCGGGGVVDGTVAAPMLEDTDEATVDAVDA